MVYTTQYVPSVLSRRSAIVLRVLIQNLSLFWASDGLVLSIKQMLTSSKKYDNHLPKIVHTKIFVQSLHLLRVSYRFL